MSVARDGGKPARSSGARNIGVAARRRRLVGIDDMPKSTSLTRPPWVRMRLPGLMSPWITGGFCVCRWVSASATSARYDRDARRFEPGLTSFAQQPREIDAIDEVHRDDVHAAFEEVLAHERQRRVRRHAKQDAGLGEQLVVVLVGPGGSDLQSDDAIVPVIERLDHAALAATAEYLEELVPPIEEISHDHHPRSSQPGFLRYVRLQPCSIGIGPRARERDRDS